MHICICKWTEQILILIPQNIYVSTILALKFISISIMYQAQQR